MGKDLGRHSNRESSDYSMNHFCVSKHTSILRLLKVICHTLGAHDVKGKVITRILLPKVFRRQILVLVFVRTLFLSIGVMFWF